MLVITVVISEYDVIEVDKLPTMLTLKGKHSHVNSNINRYGDDNNNNSNI